MNNKAFIGGKLYDVISEEEYRDHPELYNPSETSVCQGGFILPIRTGRYNPSIIGYYPGNCCFDQYVMPYGTEDQEIYSASHLVDFQSVTNLKEMVSAQNKLNSDQVMYLTSSDNIFRPNIDPINDQPLMVGFKQAVIDKGIDINKYSPRFGNDFNNDRRQFNKPKISLDKFVSIAGKLDMKATVIIEDANSNVPNPIGHKIIVDLMGNGGDE